MSTSWLDWIGAAEKLFFTKAAIINRKNGTVIATNKDTNVATMFQFKTTWKTAKKGELIVSNWFGKLYNDGDDNKFVLPIEVKNLCLQYRYAVNEIEELKKDWKLTKSTDSNEETQTGTIHLFGTKYFVVHHDEQNGRWIIGRWGNESVFALECKTIWFVVSGPVKPNGSKDSKLKPIQKLFADFMKEIAYPLLDAKV
eukprot:264240_1